MIITPTELRRHTTETLKKVDAALENPAGGDWATLLLAKAQCLHTLTLLNAQDRGQRGATKV